MTRTAQDEDHEEFLEELLAEAPVRHDEKCEAGYGHDCTCDVAPWLSRVRDVESERASLSVRLQAAEACEQEALRERDEARLTIQTALYTAGRRWGEWGERALSVCDVLEAAVGGPGGEADRLYNDALRAALDERDEARAALREAIGTVGAARRRLIDALRRLLDAPPGGTGETDAREHARRVLEGEST